VWNVLLGTGITISSGMLLVEVLDCGVDLPVSVFAMETGEFGDLGPHALKHAEEEDSHAVANVTTHNQTMEGDSVLEVVQPAKLAIHSAVQSMPSGMDGVHGLPAQMAYLRVELVQEQEHALAVRVTVVV